MFAEGWVNFLREKARQHRAEQEYTAKFGPPPTRVFVPWRVAEVPSSDDTQRSSDAGDQPEMAVPIAEPPVS